MTNASPGWQADPSGRHELRYWDGATWTEQVADGGVSSTDPIGPSGEQPAASLGAPAATGQGHPGPGGPSSSPPGGMPHAQPTPAGPSTGLLIGLGVVVLGLAAAIGVVLISDGGGDDGPGPEVETTSGTLDVETTTTAPDPTTTLVTEEEIPDDPFGMDAVVDDIIDDFQGEIDRDDARCMIREAANEGIRRDIDYDVEFDQLPAEDQTAIMFAMLDNCVDIDEVMANLMAAGMVGEGATQEQADCASTGIVEAVGAEALLEAIANAGQFGDPISELSQDDQVAVNSAVLDCM